MSTGNLRVISGNKPDSGAVYDDLEIRGDDIFAKTQAGVDEVRRQTGSAVPPKLRTVLMLIDGRTPFASFKSTLQTYGDVTQLFGILRDLGLIVKASVAEPARERPRPARPTPPSPVGGNTMASFDRDAAPTMSQLDAITQMPDMMARIALAEQAPGVYSTGMERPPQARENNVYRPAPAPAPAPYDPPQQTRTSAASGMRVEDIDAVKLAMIRDVSAILGTDAGLVISKIQGCRTRDDLFASMMGIKKIISIYADRTAADKFAARYQSLSI